MFLFAKGIISKDTILCLIIGGQIAIFEFFYPHFYFNLAQKSNVLDVLIKLCFICIGKGSDRFCVYLLRSPNISALSRQSVHALERVNATFLSWLDNWANLPSSFRVVCHY